MLKFSIAVYLSFLVSSVFAQNTTWLTDTSSNYDVIITGSGHVGLGSQYFKGAGWAGWTTSPSGKWTAGGEISECYAFNDGWNKYGYYVDQAGGLNANSVLAPGFGQFASYFEGPFWLADAPIYAIDLHGGLGPSYSSEWGWWTTLSESWDATLSNWTFEFSGYGPSLTYIPEPWSLPIICFGLLALRIWRSK